MRPLPSSVHPDFAGVPGLDAARQQRQPFANVALAVAQLRGRYGLTQSDFARRIGTTQSVIARLESGRHGIQVSLLNRIAAAFGTGWRVEFVEDEVAIGSGDESADGPPASGDDLLDAFNRANTRRDFATAHRYALRIARDVSSARRELALALDAFNHQQMRTALRRSQAALDGELPGASREVACIVAGRALIGLKRAKEASVLLRGAGDGLHARAARVEASMEQGQLNEAVDAVEALIGDADASFLPAAQLLAARVFWHADRPLDALRHVDAYRTREPDDRHGTLLNGAILGYLGDVHGDERAYELALGLFKAADSDDDPETGRLLAMTAARLGRWRDALDDARRMVDATPNAKRRYAKSAEQIAVECLDRITEPDDLEAAANVASQLGLVKDEVRRSRVAHARAMRGDFDGAVSALGLRPETLDQASPRDQIRCATAFAVSSEFGSAYDILRRNVAALSIPDGQLFLAQAALAVRDTSMARHALKRITKAGQGAAAETAKVALDLIVAIERSGRQEVLTSLQLQGEDWVPGIIGAVPDRSAPESPWEGPADRTGDPTHDLEVQRAGWNRMLPRAA